MCVFVCVSRCVHECACVRQSISTWAIIYSDKVNFLYNFDQKNTLPKYNLVHPNIYLIKSSQAPSGRTGTPGTRPIKRYVNYTLRSTILSSIPPFHTQFAFVIILLSIGSANWIKIRRARPARSTRRRSAARVNLITRIRAAARPVFVDSQITRQTLSLLLVDERAQFAFVGILLAISAANRIEMIRADTGSRPQRTLGVAHKRLCRLAVVLLTRPVVGDTEEAPAVVAEDIAGVFA